MQLGTLIPQRDIGGSPSALREFAQAAEFLGYDFLEATDHVLGPNAESRHDPFVMFGFLAGLTNLSFATGVLVITQRQAVLAAKQAASLDILCGGRFRLGVGIGSNATEFTALNQDFHERGRRSAEQVHVMQKLWASQHISIEGNWHTIEDAGINPRPASGRVPVWFGGHHKLTVRRIAKYGDGWIMLAYPMGSRAVAEFDRLRWLTEAEGRDPKSLGLEVWVSTGTDGPSEWRRELRFWKQAGVTHVTVASTHGVAPHVRIPGRTMKDHIDAIEQYRGAVADLL
jgi:probable F420-dependent oxidoreductase